jgi:cell fate regulator YaaT (PSP1 superfamily)
MAKMQKATLDPAKISGYCGRLKCCLRYEDKTYTQLKKHLPKKNAKVKTKYGDGKVVDSQILTQLVVVEHSDGVKVAVPVEELDVISSPAAKDKKQDGAADNASQGSSEKQEQ